MIKGYKYHLETCEVCGKSVPFNWYIRHFREQHPEVEAQEREEQEYRDRLQAVYDAGIPGFHTYDLIGDVMGGLGRGSVKSLIGGQRHWTEELVERLETLEWAAFQWPKAINVLADLKGWWHRRPKRSQGWTKRGTRDGTRKFLYY